MRGKSHSHPKNTPDRKTLAEIVEYVAVAILALLAAWVISGTLGTELWGGLSGHNYPY